MSADGTRTSVLIITNLETSDAGRYSCGVETNIDHSLSGERSFDIQFPSKCILNSYLSSSVRMAQSNQNGILIKMAQTVSILIYIV